MPTIRELLEARNEIYVENAVTEDDLIRVCYNKQVELRDNQAKARQHKQRKAKEVTYLSQKDREAVIILSAITQTLQNLIDDWEKLGNRPAIVIKGLKTAKTMCYKAIEWLFRGINEKDYRRVMDDVAYHQIGIYEYTPIKKTS